MSKINEVQQIVQSILSGKIERCGKIERSLAHQWDHIKRVYDIAIKIAENYKNSVNLEVLKLAILLHDIDQTCNNKENHQNSSAEKSIQILKKVGYSSDIIEKVSSAVIEHSSENDLNIIQPSSLESKILFDADKIDGVGAVGLVRALILCGQQGKSSEECIEWYQNKIKRALPFIQTKEGRDLIKDKLDFVENFFKKYHEEINNPIC